MFFIRGFKSIWRNLVFIWESFYGYRLRIFMVFLLTASFAFLEGIGLSTFIPLFYLVAPGGEAGGNTTVGAMVEKFFNFFNLPLTLVTIVGFIFLIFLAKQIFHYLAERKQAKVVYTYEKNLRDELTGLILNSDWQYFTRYKIGHLINNLVAQTHSSHLVMRNGLKLLVSMTTAVMYLVVAFLISWQTTITAILFLVVISFAMYGLIKETKRLGRESLKAEHSFTNLIQQFLPGLREVRATESEEFAQNLVKHSTEKDANAKMNRQILKAVSRMGIEFSAVVIVLAFILIALTVFETGIAEVGIIAVLFYRAFTKGANIQQAQSLAERIPSLQSVEKMKQGFIEHGENKAGGDKKPGFKRRIKFDNVSFSYGDPTGPRVLKDIGFEVKKGSFVGIVGESGAGKSTLIDLFTGLLLPSSGRILIDGIQLSEINMKDWRRLIGYVSQENFLMNDTLKNNIAMFRDISDEMFAEICEVACVDEFLHELPEGKATIVGERGVKLSGGQCQRVVLARALAREPELLILDEATSHLDTETENKIQNRLQDYLEDVTIISVAHRLSTLNAADKIVVLDSGKIIQKGSPLELKTASGKFKQLVFAQQNPTGV